MIKPRIKSRIKKLTLPIIVLILALLLMLWLSGSLTVYGQAKSDKPVSIKTCSPCHKDIDDIDVKGLIFNHKVHFARGIQCSACHLRNPHQPDKTERVSMDTCYFCHGVAHGAQGVLAPEECSLCHPKGFDLVPPSHDNNWRKRHPAQAKANLNNCYTCHKSNFCAKCHTKLGVVPSSHQAANWGKAHGEQPPLDLIDCRICHEESFCAKCHKTPMPHSVYWMPEHPELARKDVQDCYVCHRPVMCSDCHHTKGMKVTLKNCAECHKDLSTAVWRSASYIFTHKPHLAKKFACTECHPATDGTKPMAPEMKDCYSAKCHGMAKAPGPGKCEACHPPKFELKPGDHKVAGFLPKGHAKMAKEDREYCNMCHLSSFCNACHGGFEMPHPADFEAKHGPLAKKKYNACVKCHTTAPGWCSSCHHKGYKPSEGPYAKVHPKLVAKSGAQPCFKCHNPVYCAHCHVTGKKYPSIKGP